MLQKIILYCSLILFTRIIEYNAVILDFFFPTDRVNLRS